MNTTNAKKLFSVTQKCDLGKVAIWGIHGTADGNSATPPSATSNPLNNIIACPQPHRDARLTLVQGGTHGDSTWDKAYGNELPGVDIYQWFLDNALP